MRSQEIINHIWKHGDPKGLLWHAQAYQSRPGKEWLDVPVSPGEGVQNHLRFGKEWDEYFAPLGFTEDRRSNDTAATLNVLFADIDDGNILRIDGKLPSYVWRTSPGMYQAVWLLAHSLDSYDEWADLNRRLTYASGADKGGWMGSKVLRVPGSSNWKRAVDGKPAEGRIIKGAGQLHNPLAIDAVLPHIEGYRPRAATTPEPWSKEKWEATVRDMPLSIKAALFKKKVGDRSMHIVRTAGAIKSMGLSDETAYQLIRPRPWNKFAGRDEVLWDQVVSTP